MNAMLTDLLAFSRLSQEQVELQPVRLEEVIEKMMAELAFESVAASGSVKVIGPWPTVWAHHATLLQVLTNLTSNAAKFVVSGRPPDIQLRAEIRGDIVRVWVEDNGPGIPDGCHSQIFGIFTRLNGEKYAGTGIGLAIVQKGIERMGGKVGVDSTYGEGSKFWFELRIA
jgi:signal transduction histidine kinase